LTVIKLLVIMRLMVVLRSRMLLSLENLLLGLTCLLVQWVPALGMFMIRHKRV
jgi:hypothetical protein